MVGSDRQQSRGIIELHPPPSPSAAAMKIDRLEDLPQAEETAVVINCGTLAAATLALLSALKYLGMPVVLIDCESPDGSYAHFERLLDQHDFYLLQAPLRPHGVTLDWLFRTSRAEKVVLVDSDLEILSGEMVAFMRRYIDEPIVFGSGFVQGPTAIDDKPGTFLEHSVLAERPWIPFTMLRTDRVRQALEVGKSFAAKTRYGARFGQQRLLRSFIDLRCRGRIPARIRWPKWLTELHFAWRPEVVYYDTGGQLFHHLRYERELYMVALPERIHERYCTHFGGLSRVVLGEQAQGEDAKSRVQALLLQRLRAGYGLDLADRLG